VAQANGVDICNGSPRLRRNGSNRCCVAAMLSPSTGIVDSHPLMLTFQGEAEAAGEMLVLRTRCCPAGFAMTVATSTSAGTSRQPSAVDAW